MQPIVCYELHIQTVLVLLFWNVPFQLFIYNTTHIFYNLLPHKEKCEHYCVEDEFRLFLTPSFSAFLRYLTIVCFHHENAHAHCYFLSPGRLQWNRVLHTYKEQRLFWEKSRSVYVYGDMALSAQLVRCLCICSCIFVVLFVSIHEKVFCVVFSQHVHF